MYSGSIWKDWYLCWFYFCNGRTTPFRAARWVALLFCSIHYFICTILLFWGEDNLVLFEKSFPIEYLSLESLAENSYLERVFKFVSLWFISEGMNNLGAKMTSYYRCMLAKSISIVSTSSANPLTLKCQYFLWLSH